MCRRIGACDYNPEQIAAQDPDGLAFFLADGLAPVNARTVPAIKSDRRRGRQGGCQARDRRVE
jgi:hypothetical protein